MLLKDLPRILAELPPLGAEEAEAFARDLRMARRESAEAELIDPEPGDPEPRDLRRS